MSFTGLVVVCAVAFTAPLVLALVPRLRLPAVVLEILVGIAIGPNGLGWVYEYYLKVDPVAAPNGGYDLGELRAIQDWNVRFELNAIPGVADVGSLGGFVRQYQVEANPNRLRQLGLSLRDLMDAFERGNLSVGGKTIDEGGREFVVRGSGRLQTVNDIENLVVRSGASGTIRVRDAARVQLGGDFRRGALDVDGHEAVGGVVVMRSGGDCRTILERIRERVAQVNATLPRDVGDAGHGCMRKVRISFLAR